MTLQVLKSLILLCVVSSSAAYIGFKTTSKSFVEIFIIATILQFIFFYFYNSIISYITRLKLENKNLETIQLMNTNNVLIECSSCKKTNNVRVVLTEDNNFTCTHCKTENILDITFNTITKTKIYE